MSHMLGRGIVGTWAVLALVLVVVMCAHAQSSFDTIRVRGLLHVGDGAISAIGVPRHEES